MDCPFCRTHNADDAVVCAGCTRDIAVPPALILERDSLRLKRQSLLTELDAAQAQLDRLAAPRQAS